MTRAAAALFGIVTLCMLTGFAQAAQPSDLAAALPSQVEVPAGLAIVDEGARTSSEITAGFPYPAEAANRFAEWGWLENYYRNYEAVVPQPPGNLISLEISLHRFQEPHGAALALPYFAASRAWMLDSKIINVGTISSSVPGGTEISKYDQQGNVLIRVSGVGASSELSAAVASVVKNVRQRLAVPRENEEEEQLDTDEESAAAAATALSILELRQDYDGLYDRLHPDARAVIPREAVVGWYENDFEVRGPITFTVQGIELAPWTWGVTGRTYADTAVVSYQQTFGDGTVERNQLHLVRNEEGQWAWFFGGSKLWVNQQIARFVTGASPTPPALSTDSSVDSDQIQALERKVDSLSTVVANLEEKERNSADLENQVSELSTAVAGLDADVDDLRDRIRSIESSPTPVPGTEASVTPTSTPTPLTQTPIPTPVTPTPSPTPVIQTLTPRPVTPTPSPTPIIHTPTPTPPAQEGETSAIDDEYDPLADVRELEVRPDTMVDKKIRFTGTVHSIGSLDLVLANQPIQTQLGVVVEAGDGTHHAVALSCDQVTSETEEGAEVEIIGEFRGLATRTNESGIEIAVPVVKCDHLSVMQSAPADGNFQSLTEFGIDRSMPLLDSLRFAGHRIEFAGQVFSILESRRTEGLGDYTQERLGSAFQVFAFTPEGVLIGGNYASPAIFIVATDSDVSGVYQGTWLKVSGMVIGQVSYFNANGDIVAAPLLRAEKVEVLPGPPPGIKDVID